jgi:hypothetical protein
MREGLLSRLGSYTCIGILTLTAGLTGFAQAHGGARANHMVGHMQMTSSRPLQPGDKDRAAAIVAAARKAAEPYRDYRKALEDGYEIFLPEIKQDVYHFTNYAQVYRNTMNFDPARPTSLLYEKVPAKAGAPAEYKLVGVMYTAPYEVSDDELNRRVPLSVARWHLHTNLCLPPGDHVRGDLVNDPDLVGTNPKYGLQGSITTATACRAAGGRFMQHVFGWMMHVYPFETDPKKVWASGINDQHGMEHDAMPMEIPM